MARVPIPGAIMMVDGMPARAVDVVRLARSFHARSDDGEITVEYAVWALSEFGYSIDSRRKS